MMHMFLIADFRVCVLKALVNGGQFDVDGQGGTSFGAFSALIRLFMYVSIQPAFVEYLCPI